MLSKAFHAFCRRLDNFKDDLELIDILKMNIESGELKDQHSKYIFKRLDPIKHSHLIRHVNNNHTRKLIINHLRQTVYSAYIKDIYEEVSIYLKKIILCASRKIINPERFVGNHNFNKGSSG